MTPPPPGPSTPGTPPPAGSPSRTGRYRGIGAAPGRAIGPAAILRGPDAAPEVPTGAILVCRIVHPHLAPLFFRVAGVIVEEGALLQHATTLAREFGLPAVVGLAEATHLFDDGDRLRVDGDTGEVDLLAVAADDRSGWAGGPTGSSDQ